MKQIFYILLFLFVWAGAWGQAGRLHRLAGPDSTVFSTRSYANQYDNSTSGAVPTTQQAMLDSLAGFQSFADITSILAADPAVGFVLEDRATGVRYKVKSDTITGLPVDGIYQKNIGGGKYLIISNRHNFEFTNESIDSTVIKSIASNTDESTFKLSITDASSSDIVFSLPEQISSRKNITINVDDSSDKDIIISGNVSDGNYVFDSYIASDGENIVLPYTGSRYRLITNKINSFYDSDKPLDYKDIPDDYELYNDGLVGYNSGAADSLFVLTRKKSWNVKSNLIPLSSFFTHVSTPTWVGSPSLDWTREKINTPAIESDYSFKLTLLEDNLNQLANSYTFSTPAGDTIFGGREYNFSFYALIPNDQSKNVALTVRPGGSLDNALKVVMELDTSSVGEWRRYNAIVRASAVVDTFPTGRFWVSVSGDSSDYILIQDFQLTEGQYVQPYQKTHENPTINGGFNIVYKGVGDGRIYVDNVPNYYALNDNEVIQRAFNFARQTPKSPFYAYSTNLFNTVYIQKDKLLTETIARPEGINLESNYGAGNGFNDLSNHAVIFSDLQDSTKSLFTYVDEASDNVVSGATTKNVALKSLSRQRTFFLNEQLVDMLYQDIYIVTDSLSEYGIENISSVNSNLYNTFRRVEINEPRKAGLMLRGTPNFVIDCKFFRGGHAIHAESMTWVHGLVAEQQDLPVIRFNALTSFSWRDGYCEVNTTPFIQIDKATNIDIRGGLIGTVKAGNTGPPYLIALDSVYTGSISGIFAHGGIGNRISTTAATGHITINNTIGNNPTYTYPGPLSHESWDGIADSTKIVSWGNTSLGSVNDPSFWMPYLFYSTGFPDTSQLQEQLRLFKVRMDSLATITSSNVAGAASSTDNAIPRYNGITGKIIQNSGVTIDDNDVIEIGNTTFSDLGGIITKGGVRFFHDFEYGNNGTVTPDGFNLFLGRGAGNYTMGATATATAHSSFNTGIGQSTFANLTTGYRGTALGTSAGQSTTTGNNNTFVGYQAGGLNTTGGANVFIGSQAGYNNISGASNTMVGTSAGRFRSDGVTTVTTASSSVFVGNNTRAGSSDGTNQTVIGTGATSLGSNTAQIGNTSLDSIGLGAHVFDVSGTPTQGQTYVYNESTEHFEPTTLYTTGTATPTTDVSGQFNITHGLGVEPTHLDIGNKSATEYHFKYSCGSTTCTVTVTDGTGTDTVVPSTAISISWAAFR